ncbi:MAG TPA: serine/threonine-protein kinase [Jatrophihabitans sp.]|nr:serine/threonine-protein kinase [Jatrophihabitans sp.]
MANQTEVLVAGRYELRGVLGRGSMGTVHRAVDLVLDRPVAVKLFPHDAGDTRQAQRYEQEARLLASLAHPGLVIVFDAGIDASPSDDPRPYLVMELVDGQTLASRINSGPLPESDVAAIAAQLCSALAYVHRRGVVHRDIKPANILLAPSDEPGEGECAKLTDFGIARLVDGTRMTLTGFTIGTANYLSPEQLRGEDVGPPSDVYSLGLVLLEALTGRVAYPGRGAEAAFARLQRQPSFEGVSEAWQRLLRTMTDPEPTSRPKATEVAIAVTGIAEPPEQEHLPQTQVLPVIKEAPEPAVALSESPTVAARPAQAPPARTVTTVAELRTRASSALSRARLRRRPPLKLVVAAVVAVLVIVVIALSAGGGKPIRVPPTPQQYPSVPGNLGTHLQKLEKDLQP